MPNFQFRTMANLCTYMRQCCQAPIKIKQQCFIGQTLCTLTDEGKEDPGALHMICLFSGLVERDVLPTEGVCCSLKSKELVCLQTSCSSSTVTWGLVNPVQLWVVDHLPLPKSMPEYCLCWIGYDFVFTYVDNQWTLACRVRPISQFRSTWHLSTWRMLLSCQHYRFVPRLLKGGVLLPFFFFLHQNWNGDWHTYCSSMLNFLGHLHRNDNLRQSEDVGFGIGYKYCIWRLVLERVVS